MSEQKRSYMASLDEWTDKVIIDLLGRAYLSGVEDTIIDAQDSVRGAIRQKVLESYRNGQTAPKRPAQKGRAWTR